LDEDVAKKKLNLLQLASGAAEVIDFLMGPPTHIRTLTSAVSRSL